MNSYWQELLDLVLPVDCAGCGRPRCGLCEDCRQRLCGGAVRRVRVRPPPPGLPPVLAAAEYVDEVRAVLLAHKERGAMRLAEPLGVTLARAVRSAAGGRVRGGGVGKAGGGGGRAAGQLFLLPVPSARRAVAVRGHDPVLRIARGAERALRRDGWPVRTLAALRQRRTVTDQVGLGAGRRLANLAEALTVRPGADRLLAGGVVMLVDDLMTTGASLAEAARAVRQAGGEVLGAAVVAASTAPEAGCER